MGLLDLCTSDLQAWKRIGFVGGNRDDPVTFKEALNLWWNYAAVRATVLYRLSHWCYRRRIRLLPGILWRMNIRRFGLDIVPSVPVGPGLYIPHSVGTVVMARGLGRNVSLITNVTIGMRNTHEFPFIGNDVTIGAGARVLGGIVVGDGATVGANAVVIDDVPPGVTVVGIPAKPTRLREFHYGKQSVEAFYDS
jgi:serine O-acetyltransferase